MQFIDEILNWNNVSLYNFVLEGNYPFFWRDFFTEENVVNEIEKISDTINLTPKIVYPELRRVFRAFIPIEKIKIVILGQDPYHNGNAVGLCFSIPINAAINPSLRNIYTEIENEGYDIIKNGDLSHWMAQGCFMLNTALTVEQGNPGSHSKIWANFTRMVVQHLNSKDNITWLLMGRNAISMEKYIVNRSHTIFRTSHPSPFSAYNSSGEIPAFMGSGVFRKINDLRNEKIVW